MWALTDMRWYCLRTVLPWCTVQNHLWYNFQVKLFDFFTDTEDITVEKTIEDEIVATDIYTCAGKIWWELSSPFGETHFDFYFLFRLRLFKLVSYEDIVHFILKACLKKCNNNFSLPRCVLSWQTVRVYDVNCSAWSKILSTCFSGIRWNITGWAHQV